VAATTTMATMMKPTLVSSGGTEAPPKKACFVFLGVSSHYVCGAACPSRGFLLHLSSYTNSKCDFWMIGVVPWVSQLFVDWSRA
jgi:hypothetical protein